MWFWVKDRFRVRDQVSVRRRNRDGWDWRRNIYFCIPAAVTVYKTHFCVYDIHVAVSDKSNTNVLCATDVLKAGHITCVSVSC